MGVGSVKAKNRQNLNNRRETGGPNQSSATALRKARHIMSLVTYSIEKMRVTRPGAKTAAANPDRLYTVTGTFYSTETDAKGKVTRKDKLTIPSKNIDKATVLVEGFALDIANGILTLPEGNRGRKAFESLTAEDIMADLAALRETVEPEVEADPTE